MSATVARTFLLALDHVDWVPVLGVGAPAVHVRRRRGRLVGEHGRRRPPLLQVVFVLDYPQSQLGTAQRVPKDFLHPAKQARKMHSQKFFMGFNYKNSHLEWHVEQVVAVDFDDAIAKAEAAVLVDSAAGLDALHQEASVLA